MVWSPELTAAPGTGPTEWSSRLGQPVRLFQVHHTANFNIDAAYALMLPGDRTVSCNALVGPKGEKWGVVPEEYRAFTSGSAMVDRMSYTVETVNSTGAPTWGISAAAHEALVDLLVDVATRHKFWPNRQGDKKTWTVIGHREIGEIWPGESYATACPGGIDLDRLTADAQKRMSNPESESDMRLIRVPDGTVFLVTASGVKPITSAAHLTLLQRVLNAAPGEYVNMTAAEGVTVRSYFTPPAAPAPVAEPAAAPPQSFIITGTLTPKEA